MSIGEILATGGQTILIGLGIVFLVLFVLVWIINLLTAVLGQGKKKTPTAPPAPPKATPAPAPVPAVPTQDEEEIVAVIAAAVAAIASREGSRLRVRSVRRVGQQAPVWSRAAR